MKTKLKSWMQTNNLDAITLCEFGVAIGCLVVVLVRMLIY